MDDDAADGIEVATFAGGVDGPLLHLAAVLVHSHNASEEEEGDPDRTPDAAVVVEKRSGAGEEHGVAEAAAGGGVEVVVVHRKKWGECTGVFHLVQE